jgi:hypothetical protein
VFLNGIDLAVNTSLDVEINEVEELVETVKLKSGKIHRTTFGSKLLAIVISPSLSSLMAWLDSTVIGGSSSYEFPDGDVWIFGLST